MAINIQMKLLLDTQVFIWLTNGDDKVGVKARHLLEDVSNQIYLSYFSCFEMTIKASIGKLDYDPSILDDLPKMGIELIMPSTTVLENYVVFNPHNKDPFDNMLIAVACEENTTFITSDQKVLSTSYSGFKVIEATK